MFDDFRDWIKLLLGESYRYTQGQWVEDQSSEGDFYCAIRTEGGSAPDVDDRRVMIHVTLLGPRNDRGAVKALGIACQTLMTELVADERSLPCNASNIGAAGEPIGPGYTTENRVWFTLGFSLLM